MKIRILLATLAVLVVTACTTTGHFQVPPDTQLYLYKRPNPVNIAPDGTVTTKPFFWTAAGVPPGGGIPYRLERNGKTIQQGKLRAKFRVVSVFWPPFALIYWPMGMNPSVDYDLIHNTQKSPLDTQQ